MGRRAADWHERRLRPRRAAAIAALRRQLADVEIVELDGGNHVDFVLSRHAEVVGAMRAFLMTRSSGGSGARP